MPSTCGPWRGELGWRWRRGCERPGAAQTWGSQPPAKVGDGVGGTLCPGSGLGWVGLGWVVSGLE